MEGVDLNQVPKGFQLLADLVDRFQEIEMSVHLGEWPGGRKNGHPSVAVARDT